MDELLVAVGGRRGRGDQLILHAPELGEKRLVGLAPEAPQHGRLIQGHGREAGRVDVPVPHPLIVGHHDLGIRPGQVLHGGDVDRGGIAKDLLGVPGELLAHPQGEHDQGPPAIMPHGLMAELDLLHGLPQAEALEKRPASAPQGPDHSVPLVWFQPRIDLPRVQLKSALLRQHDL